MVKRMVCLALGLFVTAFAFSQQVPQTYQEPEQGFDKSRLFLGGSIALGFSSGSFNIGANPEIGYSVTDWLDAGIGINLNYFSLNADYNYGVTQHSFNYGLGPFVRAYPLNFLFVQAQLEQNWMHYNLKDVNTGQTSEFTTNAPSVLLGLGYSQRLVGQANYYMALLFDVNDNPNSPYRDGYNHAIPIIRAGFNIYLNKGHRK
ncbi:hypothetical protein QTN47_08965 [Danxiaibacter flavus]|uniref:Outer membrane protein beta-barrel domain-containing protein n=1 Tax=Danxiaibacter flavus TaxID=3049108 RepID=A0ABV3ZDF2_9BACT|nr:hypothetical protein QNM32_08965 [Chitinophagaceae bacterium DXS]